MYETAFFQHTLYLALLTYSQEWRFPLKSNMQTDSELCILATT